MSIKVVVLDISNTTLDNQGNPREGIPDLIEFCKAHDLKIVFATNNLMEVRRLQKTQLKFDLLVTPVLAGALKPSPRFIEYIEGELNLSRDEFLYIGDDDKTDACLAANSRVLYISAGWANPDPKYGILISTPQEVIEHIQKYLMKDIYWAWTIDEKDHYGRRVRISALLNCSMSIRSVAVSGLKSGQLSNANFFLNHLVSSIYLSGMFKEVDYWATYPSSTKGDSINSIMQNYLDVASKEFHKKYQDLFVRHKTAKDSGASRYSGQGGSIDFNNQIETVNLNPKFKNKLCGKRILLIDDFVTEGHSMECARNLLYLAGVNDVIGVSVGKYGVRYQQVSIGERVDPFQPIKAGSINPKSLMRNAAFQEPATRILEDSFDIHTNL